MGVVIVSTTTEYSFNIPAIHSLRHPGAGRDLSVTCKDEPQRTQRAQRISGQFSFSPDDPGLRRDDVSWWVRVLDIHLHQTGALGHAAFGCDDAHVLQCVQIILCRGQAAFFAGLVQGQDRIGVVLLFG